MTSNVPANPLGVDVIPIGISSAVRSNYNKAFIRKVFNSFKGVPWEYNYRVDYDFNDKMGKNEGLNEFMSRAGDELSSIVFDNRFISESVVEYVKRNNLIVEKIGHGNLSIYIWCRTSFKPSKSKMNKIIHICEFMNKIKGTKKPIKLRIIYTDLKKKFGGDNWKSNKNILILTPDNINSGSTLPDSYINLWRSEELEKVLIHELVHYLNLEVKRQDMDDLTKYYSKFNYEGFDSPAESYTEVIACIIHSCYVCDYMKYSGETQDCESLLVKAMTNEVNFSLFQIANILDKFNMSSRNILKPNQNKIKQKTSVFSYHVIKGFLIANLGDTLEFLNNYFDRFNKKKYIDLIEKSISDDKTHAIIGQHSRNIKNGTISSNSLRMTINQTK